MRVMQTFGETSLEVELLFTRNDRDYNLYILRNHNHQSYKRSNNNSVSAGSQRPELAELCRDALAAIKQSTCEHSEATGHRISRDEQQQQRDNS